MTVTAGYDGGPRARVAVIYDGFPHYRKGIIEELAASERCKYVFFFDSEYRDASIKTYTFGPEITVVHTRSLWRGPFLFQRGILSGIRKHDISHCIFLGNPWFISYWLLTPLLRLRGKKVFFWSHGWLSRHEPRLRKLAKSIFFRLPHGLLLYGARSKAIGATRGFSPERMHVISNSLDYRAQRRIYDDLQRYSQGELRTALGFPLGVKVIVCTARLTRTCRFDLLMQAAAVLQKLNVHVFLVLVGDGPETTALFELGRALGIPFRLWGACYDELTIAKIYRASDLTVSPGKVGLTAMHSMAYGTPVISHDNLDRQMPEVEAIQANITGAFFKENSSEDLARVIAEWFETHPNKPEKECIDRIEAGYTPAFQRSVIEAAILA